MSNEADNPNVRGGWLNNVPLVADANDSRHTISNSATPGAKYDTTTGHTVDHNGAVLSAPNTAEDFCAYVQAGGTLPDPGGDLGAHVERINGEVAAFEARTDEILRYNSETGEPIYVLSSVERANRGPALKALKDSAGLKIAELNGVTYQRLKQQYEARQRDKQNVERNARIAQYTEEALERLVADEQAREIYKARKR